MSAYNVKTPIFEGPLDTLLNLIEKRKLFVNDISLAQVADDYITYVKSIENFPIADSAHFILIASTLVLIKSKSLLPNLTLTEEEQGSIDDLEERLREYQKYKRLTKYISEKFGLKVTYNRLPPKEKKVVFSPDKNTNTKKLKEVILYLINQIPKPEIVQKAVIEKVISLEEMIENLTDRINRNLKISFKDFSGHGKKNKIEVIVGFLAMLELVKQGIINVKQDRDFQDIEMETQYVGVPTY